MKQTKKCPHIHRTESPPARKNEKEKERDQQHQQQDEEDVQWKIRHRLNVHDTQPFVPT